MALVSGTTVWADKSKVGLENTSWEVTVVNMQNPDTSGVEDIFSFQKNQFRSRNLSARGFADTNYTLSQGSASEKPLVWETMQTGKEGIVFLRGEWDGDKMQGNISELLENGQKVVDYSFVMKKNWQGQQTIPAAVNVPVVPAAKKVQEKPREKKLSIPKISAKKEEVVIKPVSVVRPAPSSQPLKQFETPETVSEEDKFSEEIEKFEKAQAAALKPAQL